MPNQPDLAETLARLVISTVRSFHFMRINVFLTIFFISMLALGFEIADYLEQGNDGQA